MTPVCPRVSPAQTCQKPSQENCGVLSRHLVPWCCSLWNSLGRVSESLFLISFPSLRPAGVSKLSWTLCLASLSSPFRWRTLVRILLWLVNTNIVENSYTATRTIVLFWPCSLVDLLTFIVCFCSSHTLCNPSPDLGQKPTLPQLSVSA